MQGCVMLDRKKMLILDKRWGIDTRSLEGAIVVGWKAESGSFKEVGLTAQHSLGIVTRTTLLSSKEITKLKKRLTY